MDPGPFLLGYATHDNIKQETDDSANWKSLPKHRDEDQVRLDVDRSFIYYPNGASFAACSIVTYHTQS
jgi:TBC1 domain family member 20